ncbi:sulfatase-like hydrolase/transferase [Halarchaeum sp. P4]|uniref:sulfatase-like hydrolase/transferase n=1 Tax=Halarchaeum sp. P4 TaxID=3421639 RepID=UPI003EBD655E
MSRNVVVCCLDTVRQDYFARFAPRLRERAALSVPGCRAASGWSVPSHASMLTGRLPHEHDVHTYAPRFDTLDVADTVFGDLPDHRAIGASANVYAGSAFGFGALFDDFVDVSRDHRFVDGLNASAFVDDHPEPGLGRYRDLLVAAASHENPLPSLANAVCLALDQSVETGLLAGVPTPFDDGAATLTRAFGDLADASDEPFVGFCNFMEAHEPHRDTLGYDDERYDVPRGWRSTLDPGTVATADGDVEARLERYRSTYGAAIEYLDRRVAAFVDDVRARTERETTVIVTADHGENLGSATDGGALGHVTSLSEGILNVPFLVINPPTGYAADAGRGRLSHCSLRRLVRGFARDETPEFESDDRVVAEVVGPTPGNDELIEDAPERWDRGLRATYDGDRKVVWDDTGDVSAYDIDPDRPCWQRRVPGDADRPPASARRFDGPLEDYRERAMRAGGEREVSAAVAERLDDLGYR